MADEDAFSASPFRFPRSRFLEHTDKSIAQMFRQLSNEIIDTLKETPAMLVHEKDGPEGIVVRLKSITVVGKELEVAFQEMPGADRVPTNHLITWRELFGLQSGEEYRTHWAIKDVDLPLALDKSGLVVPDVVEARATGAIEDDASASTTVTPNRTRMIFQIDSLLRILSENIEAIDSVQNSPPAIDLDLRSDENLAEEVRKLRDELQLVRKTLEASVASARSESIGRDVLRVFAVKLAEGTAGTINWAARALLIYLSSDILSSIGGDDTGLLHLAQNAVSETSD